MEKIFSKIIVKVLFMCASFCTIAGVSAQSNWLDLTAEYMAGQQIVVTITLDQIGFESYVNSNNVNSIQVELYSKLPGSGTLVNMIASDIVLTSTISAQDVNVDTWSLVIDGSLLESGNQLAALILENTNACNEPFILNPTPYTPPQAPTCSSDFEFNECTNPNESPVVAGTTYTFNGLNLEITNSNKGVLYIPFGGFAIEVDITNSLMSNGCNEITQGAISASAAGSSGLLNTSYSLNKKSLEAGETVDICLPPPPPPAEDVDPEQNSDAIDYLDTNSSYIDGLIAMAVSDLESSIGIAILTQSGSCNELRTTMNDILNAPANGLSDIVSLIKGEAPNYIYFEEGLSNHFTSPPSLPNDMIQRDENIVLLESYHIDLYNCDVSLQQLEEAYSNVGALPANYIEIILYQISIWTGYEYQLYTTNEAEFKDWITDILIEIAAGDLTEAGNLITNNDPVLSFMNADDIDSQLKSELQNVFVLETRKRFEASVIKSEKKGNIDDLRNQFERSFKKGNPLINGVDRIYYERDIAQVAKQLKTISSGLSLPLSLTSQYSSKPYDIIIESLSVTASGGALVTAALLIEDPKSGCDIIFRGTDLAFGPGGFADDVDSKMELVTDIVMRLNNAAALHLLGTDTGQFGTYVTWDCYGFKEISVDAQVEFCPDYVKKINADNTVNSDENFKLGVNLQIQDWNNFRIEAGSTDKFALAKYETIIWEAGAIVLDFSTSITQPNTIFAEYESPFKNDNTNTLENEWEGFYVADLSVTIPAEFTGDNVGGANDLVVAVDLAVIDDTGFSGEATASGNLISLGEGNLNGWAFSVNNFNLKIVQNNFTGASFGGTIQLPILDDPLSYTAQVYPDDEYEFTVGNINASFSPLFNADVSLTNSQVTVTKNNLGFLASANLNGSISFVSGANTNSDFPEFNVPNLEFTDLTLQNMTPYFSAGNWNTDGSLGVSLGGFSLALNNINAATDVASNETGLAFNVDLVVSDAMDIAAKGDFNLVGKLDYENGRQKWMFDRFEMNGLTVDAPIGSVAHVSGGVKWTRNDSDWGNYFRGSLEVDVEKLAGVTITGIGQFGKLNSDKYFYVDLMSSLPVDIPAGPIQFNALGLGLYRNMDYDNSNVNITQLLSSSSTNASDLIDIPGASLSAGQYSVQAGIDFGFKGLAQFKAANERLINGSISLGAQFTGTTIDKLYLDGTLQFLADLNNDLPASSGSYGNDPAPVKPGTSDKIPFAAYAAFEMDFGNNTFTGDLGAYLNASPLEGVGTDGALVLGKIHFGPDAWYVKMGKPNDPAGIRLNLAPIGTLSATSYFQMGTDTDPIAEVPQEIRDLAYTASRNESLLTSGQGIVAGAKLEFDGGVGVDGLVSIDVHALAGFDVMLRNYEGVTCDGDPVGINGWYATGQLYALLEGTLTVLGVNILSAGVAALIQAQMPNPFFADATIAVRAKIGFVTVKKSLTLTLGESCILQADTPAAVFGAEVIASITPGQDEQNVSILAQPEAHFNFPLNRNFSMPSLGGGTSTFRVDVKSVEINDTQALDYEIAEDGLGLTIYPFTSLPENEAVKIKVSVELFENGIALSGGVQSKEIIFNTGGRIDNIPSSNVKHAYPFDGMEYFYKDQFSGNFIDLYSAQNYLFEGLNVAGILTTRSAAVPLIGGANGEVQIPINFNISNNRISFQIPNAITKGDYKLEIVQILETGEREVLHAINFGVSEYATFTEKMQELENNMTTSGYAFPGEEKFGINEKEELLVASLQIDASAKDPFLEQFNQFGNCSLCPLNINQIMNDNKTTGISIARGLTITYEKYYRSLFNDLLEIISNCVGTTCTGFPICETGNEGENTAEGCAMSAFAVLGSGQQRARIRYEIPGGQSSTYTINL